MRHVIEPKGLGNEGIRSTKWRRAAFFCAVVFLGYASNLAAAPTVVGSFQPGQIFRDVVTDGSTLYIAAPDRILSMPISGGSLTTLYTSSQYSQSGAGNISSLTVVGNDIYWADNQSGPATDTQILRAPKAGGGAPVAIYTGAFVGEPIVDATGITTDGTQLFIADAIQGRVHSMNLDGSDLTQIGPNRYGGFFGDARLNDIAYGSGALFVAQSAVKTSSSPPTAPVTAALQTHSAIIGSGPWTDLAVSPGFLGDGPRGIAFDAGTLYFTEGGSLYSISTAGGVRTEIVDPPGHTYEGLTIFSGNAFIADNTAQGAQIIRVGLTTQAVPEPATLALFGVGLAALGLIRPVRCAKCRRLT
jgi:hypothetical protein